MNEQGLNDLRLNFLFTGLNDEQFTQIRETARLIEVNEGEHLFHCGDVASHFFWLQQGLVQLYRLSPSGEEKVIDLIQAGQTFAEAVMFFKHNQYPVSAKSVRDSQLWMIDMSVFLGFLQESNELCLHMLGDMSRRLHNAIKEIDQLTLQNASVRVIHFLLQSAPPGQPDHYSLEWDTPKQVLASRLSVRPETFSRILQQLIRQQLISVNGKTVEVLDHQGLRKVITLNE
ncbi:MAG: Crp/Fnr family transcriptional regulator [Methylicorpusculum sp.]|nr:Crp/Fnr family transcriptional regulator [Methylicorpusculum sp.]